MSNIGNKETMSKNLKYFIAQSGKDRRELAEIWGFPYSTVTEWINGRKYPRIDRIEIMADYFGIQKSDLIEERNISPDELVLTEGEKAWIRLLRRIPADRQPLLFERLLSELDNLE